MTVRRNTPLPQNLLVSANKSAFTGSLGGRVRSAKPTKRRNIPNSPNTSYSPTGGGQIFFAAAGVTDVGPGDLLMDLSGQLWWKTSDGDWTHLYSGTQEFGGVPTTYKPQDVSGLADIFLGPSNGYSSLPPYSGTANQFLGLRNTIDPDSAFSTIIGHDNESPAELTHALLIGHQNDVAGGSGDNLMLVGAYNDLNTTAATGDLMVYGSFQEISGDVHTSQLFGFFNQIDQASNAADDVFLGGYINQINGTEDVYSVTLLGQNNVVNSPTAPSYYLAVLGNSITLTDSKRSLAAGSGLSISGVEYTVVQGVSNDVSGSYAVAIGAFQDVTADYSVVIGDFSTVSGEYGIAIGYGNTVDNPYSWIFGPYYDVATADTEEGILVAQHVSIHRSNDGGVTGGTSETSLGLDDTAGAAHILTVDTSGVLLVDGSPITGGATGYNHTQGSSSATWTVTHNLGYYPVVAVVDGSGDEIDAQIHHNSVNQTVITLSTASTGSARFI